jgi:hypothetical protein
VGDLSVNLGGSLGQLGRSPAAQLGGLAASPIGMDDNASDADSPFPGARLSDYTSSLDRTGVDTSSIANLSSSLADVRPGGAPGTASKRKLQNISGYAGDASLVQQQQLYLSSLR